jgi:hypothetical protein
LPLRSQAGATITLKVENNPKRPGSKAHERFALYFHPDAKTVHGALSLGILKADLKNDVEKQYIRIVPHDASDFT